MTRVGIYARRSAADDRAGKSVGEQEALGRADADEQGWLIAAVYVDDGRSASRFARKIRENWVHVLTDVQAHRYDVLWLWETDRGSRQLTDWSGLLDSCRKAQVSLYIHTHRRLYDPSVARDWRSLAEEGVDSAYLSEKISINTRRGMEGSAVAGRPHGNVPYGYRRFWKINPATGERTFEAEEIDPVKGPAVQEAARRVLAGESLRAICRDFDARGIPTARGRGWTPNSLRYILLAPRNIGDRIHNGERVAEGKWPPLLDRGTYDRVKSLLEDPTRRSTSSTAVKHLLSVIANCGSVDRDGKPCDQIIVAGRYRNSPIYRCRLGHVVRQRQPVDEFVHGVMHGLLDSPDFAAALSTRDDARAQAARDEAAALRAQLNIATDRWADQQISYEQFMRATARLRPKIASAEAEAERFRDDGLLRSYAGPAGPALWGAAPIATQRAILAACFDIRLLPTGRGRRVFDPASIELTPKW